MYSSYYTVMARPDVYGLHDLWNSPTVNCTAYEDGKRPGDVLAITAKRSLCESCIACGGGGQPADLSRLP